MTEAVQPNPESRRRFLDDRRRSSRRRYNTSIWKTFDRDWGAVSDSHRSMVSRLLAATPDGGVVLDAACGTGKYWDLVLESGRTVVGVDQSTEMLRVAGSKFPEVETHRIALQDLGFERRFDSAMCIDAMENVGPEDWPPVLAALRDAVVPGGHLYLTIELPDDQAADDYRDALDRGDPVVPGEAFDGVTYHYYPTSKQVDEWLSEARLETLVAQTGDFYRHVLARRPA